MSAKNAFAAVLLAANLAAPSASASLQDIKLRFVFAHVLTDDVGEARARFAFTLSDNTPVFGLFEYPCGDFANESDVLATLMKDALPGGQVRENLSRVGITESDLRFAVPLAARQARRACGF